MKPSVLHYLLLAVLAVILFPQVILADDVSVNSQSSGQSVTCINGNCTTTGGGSKSTVCVNGQCTTTDNGNVNYNSPDGHTHIEVNNNTGDNSISVTAEPSAGATDVSPSPVPTDTPIPSITPDPTIVQMRNDINNHVREEIDGIKEHVKDQDAAVATFIDQQMKSLQDLFTNLFK